MTDTALTLLKDWLLRDALPLWAERGVDNSDGGFFERLSPQGDVLNDNRRARLVGRQIYAFSVADALGWSGPARALVAHGVDFLLDRMIQGDAIVPLVSPRDWSGPVHFDLYDQAFVLFGLAAAADVDPRREMLIDLAARLRNRMLHGWKHPIGGFEESAPPTTPLKANPHMHMLEASLAWAAVSDEDGRWARLADEIVELCLERFLDPDNGALREFFDANWGRLDGQGLDVVEPGHQFEWAWLLIRWGVSRDRKDAISAARRLISLAETFGVSSQGLAVNELEPDLDVRVGRHRLWPQTERIKAFVALGWIAETEAESTFAREKVEDAARGLLRFLEHPVAGAWWEHLEVDGTPAPEPVRASSLYHITCAISEMTRQRPARADQEAREQG